MSYGQKKTVVICDDEQDLLQVFELALESEYNVILASSGKECIDRFLEEKNQGNKVHLILLDSWRGEKIDVDRWDPATLPVVPIFQLSRH